MYTTFLIFLFSFPANLAEKVTNAISTSLPPFPVQLTPFVRGSTDWNRPPWPGTMITICISYLVTGGPGKECRTSHDQLEELGKSQKERGDSSPYVLPTSQNPPLWNPSWLSDACATRKDPESEWLARDNPETNPITIKPESVSHMAEQSSWVSLPCCCPPGCPFPIKSLALSARVSHWTIHFRVLDKSPLLGPGSSPSCNTFWLSPLSTQKLLLWWFLLTSMLSNMDNLQFASFLIS